MIEERCHTSTNTSIRQIPIFPKDIDNETQKCYNRLKQRGYGDYYQLKTT